MQLSPYKKIAIAILFFVLPVNAAMAESGSSASYRLNSAEISSSSGSGSSASYAIPDYVIGGNIDGTAASQSYALCTGTVEETSGQCIGPPVPPPPPPPPPPPSTGGSTGGSGYIPPKETTIPPEEEPQEPLPPPEKPDLPQEVPYPPVDTTTPGVTPSEEGPQQKPAQPATGIEQTRPSAGQPSQETISGRPIGLLPSIPGMGDTGYGEIPGTPLFTLTEAQEDVWCGKSSCAGEPVQYLRPTAAARQVAKKASWHGWFVLSLAIVVIMLWVQYLVYAPEPRTRPRGVRKAQHRRGGTRVRIRAKKK